MSSGPISDFSLEPSLLDPLRADTGWAETCPPLAFLDLNTCPTDLTVRTLPPFPVIGIGNSAHPLAGKLDAIVEEPIGASALIRQVTRTPLAAAVAIQLLRALEGIDYETALSLESCTYGLLQGSAEYDAWLASRPKVTRPLPDGRLTVERHDSTLHITIDRPQAYNAINRTLRDQLWEAFSLADLDREIRTIKLRAAGAVFSTGGDLGEFGTTRDPATAHLIRSRSLPARMILRRAQILDVHVQGACIGAGMEMAAFARRLTATPDAWFQLPELSMGLIPGAGGCVSVPRRIGRQRAALLILSGRRINATTALRWGLVDAIRDSPDRLAGI
ncbi:MAG TPA: enoyl-CoA hydratase/isomerase family protein [Rhodopila sp.]